MVNTIDFITHIIKEFPFRIKQICTDNGHKFQLRFSSHFYDLGIGHVHIKPGTPYLNGKAVKSHRVDK